MARFCMCGCGNELKTKDGRTDYDRQFFSSACRAKDKSQRMRDERSWAKKQKRCSKCGRPLEKKSA